MFTPYVDVIFTTLTELSIECTVDHMTIWSDDKRCNVVLFLTEDRKEAIRNIVRQWDLDDEAEARGENAVCADCGEPTSPTARNSIGTCASCAQDRLMDADDDARCPAVALLTIDGPCPCTLPTGHGGPHVPGWPSPSTFVRPVQP